MSCRRVWRAAAAKFLPKLRVLFCMALFSFYLFCCCWCCVLVRESMYFISRFPYASQRAFQLDVFRLPIRSGSGGFLVRWALAKKPQRRPLRTFSKRAVDNRTASAHPHVESRQSDQQQEQALSQPPVHRCHGWRTHVGPVIAHRVNDTWIMKLSASRPTARECIPVRSAAVGQIGPRNWLHEGERWTSRLMSMLQPCVEHCCQCRSP